MNLRRLALGLVLLAAVLMPTHRAQAAPVQFPATPGTACDAKSRPEGAVQGYIPPEDKTSGRMFKGYWCNVTMVAHVGPARFQNVAGGGGFRVERFVDSQGHECAYYDTTPLAPGSIEGVAVLDMSQSPPAVTSRLRTAAMLSPHESLRVNQARGLLVAALSNPATYPGVVDIYDLKEDCRTPRLLASTPLGILGHESGFAPDGRTFYVTSIVGSLAALDLTDPSRPRLLYHSRTWSPHGVSLSDDGRTLFMATGSGPATPQNSAPGQLVILDVSEIQQRRAKPKVRELSRLTWPEASIPQNATPFQSNGHNYVVETDEFGGDGQPVGATRIINVDNLRKPFVVSRLRLEVHNRATSEFTTHYCTLPSRIDPAVVACGFLGSGLRVFDIQDVANPREVAYANFTQYQNRVARATNNRQDTQAGNVYAAPAFDPDSNDVWFSDTQRGFFAVHLTPATKIKRLAPSILLPGS